MKNYLAEYMRLGITQYVFFLSIFTELLHTVAYSFHIF